MLQFHRTGRSGFLGLALWIGAMSLGLSSAPAYAIPSFARQTGLPCSTCHTVFPELTVFGRQFKLQGYTLGNQLDDKPFPYSLPLAVGLQVGNTGVADTAKGADPDADFEQASQTIVQQAAFYYGGRIVGPIGAMAQYNWDGIEKHWGAEMVDIRAFDRTTAFGKDLIYGVSLANSPAMQDLWATTPMWSFPHLEMAGIMPMQTSLFDMALDNQVGVVTLYGYYDSQYYGALGLMGNGKRGIFAALNLGDEQEIALQGTSPHLRLAWEKDWDGHSLMVGLHALRARVFPDPETTVGPIDTYSDLALDSQYQAGAGDHMYSVHLFVDREKRNWDASYPMGMASNPSDSLKTVKASVHYWYRRMVGGGVGLFDYQGDSDMLKYGMGGMPSAMGNASGSPDTRGWIVEANYLPLKNAQNLKLGLRYTAYTKFNGASHDYNGFGRDASDNNAWFGYVWLLF